MKIINKIKRNLLEKYEMQSISPNKKLSNEITEFYYSHKNHFIKIKQEYAKYVNSISSEEMAISLELANFLFAYCMINKPKKLADLGSGFSSYIFRYYQSSNPTDKIEIVSIDDNSEWLLKSKAYIAECSLESENFNTLVDFESSALENSFDFILLDLNYVEVRKNYFDFCIRLLRSSGVLIIDDVHKIEFLRQVKAFARKNSKPVANIRTETVDKFGRFSILLYNE